MAAMIVRPGGGCTASLPACREIARPVVPVSVPCYRRGINGLTGKTGGGWRQHAARDDGAPALDLVITVDTSIPHLAGALGQQTWVLLCTTADWRWRRDDDHSPWYPTMRLFRQTTFNGWDDVAERIVAGIELMTEIHTKTIH